MPDLTGNDFDDIYRVTFDTIRRQYIVEEPAPEPRVAEEVSVPRDRLSVLNDPPVFESITEPDVPSVPVPPIPGADNYIWDTTSGTMSLFEMVPCACCGTRIQRDHNVRDQMRILLDERMEDPPPISGGLVICASCARVLEYTRCDDCGDEYIDPHHNDFRFNELPVNYRYGVCLATGVSGDHRVCERCSEEYHYCEQCGEHARGDNGDFLGEYFYCNGCFDDARENYYEQQGHIQDYHSSDKTDQFFSISDSDSERGYMGIELEVENSRRFTDNNSASNSIIECLPDNLVVMERDGSLNNGFEIITKPMTYAYWKDVRDQWHGMLEMLSRDGFRSHNGGNCGIHVHLGVTALGKTQSEREATLTKITWVYENYWDDIVRFSRRSSNRINEWACRYGQNGWQTIDRIVKAKGDGAGKYASINMSPLETIEFRVFRGTLVPSSFDAIIDFVWGLLEGVKRMTMDEIEGSGSLYELVHPEYLNDSLIEYMRGRDIGGSPIHGETDGEDDMEVDA